MPTRRRRVWATVHTALATIYLAAACTMAAAQEPEPWPHLSPEGWGLVVRGGGLNHGPWDYRPREIAGAVSYLQVRFLPEARTGERIDVWVPDDGRTEPLPCVVLFYGGGWGGKVAGGLHPYAEDLMARGYVVAMPDYLLQAESPVPAAIWDGAAAIRFLRARAAAYRIDPARIGVWGFSAGGWLVQYLCPSDSSTLFPVQRRDPKRPHAKLPPFAVPMLDPHPALPEQPLKVQGVVSDWGCGRLGEERVHALNPHWFGPDDPPVLTCHNVRGETPDGPRVYREAGAVAEVVHLEVKGTHVPPGDVPGVDEHGHPTTWKERIYRFFDEYVKSPRRATSPEAVPAGGPIPGPTPVVLRSVHADATIHYTLDGSDPTPHAPVYRGPLSASPGGVLKAIAAVPGLRPSPVATFRFGEATRPAPVITITESHFRAKVGKPFVTRLAARGEGVTWHLCGRPGNVIDRQHNPPRLVPWLDVDPQTGELSGTPDAPGYAVVIVVASVDDGEQTLCDARRIVVTVDGEE